MKRYTFENYYVADFETVTFHGQDYTEVWAAAITNLEDDLVEVFDSIECFMAHIRFITKFKSIKVYFHNAKFDCSFLLDYFLRSKLYNQAVTGNLGDYTLRFLKNKDMPNNTYKYTFSDKGQFYSLTLKLYGHTVEFIDSMKLLPMSVDAIGKSWKTKAQKGKIDYTRHRHACETITDEEKEYIKSDVLVVKEALKFMFANGHTKLTIGSCCMSEFKRSYGIFKGQYELDFPDLRDQESAIPGTNLWDYTHKSYRGAWCYVKKERAGKLIKRGLTLDVNSLYPSVMHSESGNYYPIGTGKIFTGDIPEKYKDLKRFYYFVRIKTRFYLKPGYLPFMQIKDTFKYKGNEMLETSDILNKKDGKYYKYYRDLDGTIKPATVELTLTCTDFIRLQEFYTLEDMEILDGVVFYAAKGIFDNYINKYRDLKINAKNKAERQLAKLFLNNLYGKLAASSNSSFKYAALDKDKDHLKFYNIPANDKTPGYIACGSAITSYARDFIIRAAQANYRYFCYCDTDSLHLNCSITDIKNIVLHSTNFCAFKCETEWSQAIFVRQKCYIEQVYAEDLDYCEYYYNIVCAGMPKQCKNKISHWLYAGKDDKLFKITDFKKGLEVTGKLQQSYIRGGMILSETSFKIKEEVWCL